MGGAPAFHPGSAPEPVSTSQIGERRCPAGVRGSDFGGPRGSWRTGSGRLSPLARRPITGPERRPGGAAEDAPPRGGRRRGTARDCTPLRGRGRLLRAAAGRGGRRRGAARAGLGRGRRGRPAGDGRAGGAVPGRGRHSGLGAGRVAPRAASLARRRTTSPSTSTSATTAARTRRGRAGCATPSTGSASRRGRRAGASSRSAAGGWSVPDAVPGGPAGARGPSAGRSRRGAGR